MTAQTPPNRPGVDVPTPEPADVASVDAGRRELAALHRQIGELHSALARAMTAEQEAFRREHAIRQTLAAVAAGRGRAELLAEVGDEETTVWAHDVHGDRWWFVGHWFAGQDGTGGASWYPGLPDRPSTLVRLGTVEIPTGGDRG